MDAAAIALQPGLRPVPDIAREEVAAEEAILRVGVRDWPDRAARPGRRVAPWLACVLVGTAEHRDRGSLGVGEIVVARACRLRGGRRGRRLERRGLGALG